MMRWGKVILFEKKKGILGYNTYLLKKRKTFYVAIKKLVADGCGLCKGQNIACYYFVTDAGRPVLEVFLDGRDKDGKLLEKR
jgi:hypothetical protein